MIPLLLFLLLAGPLSAQSEPSLDWYHEQAGKAMENENYETAVRLIEEGKARYPQSPELNLLLANLYYDKELYPLALDEYLEADQKGGEDFYTLNQIARCYGRLNREQDSIAYLNRLLELYPDSVTVIDDLGWMYFKTHQLKKGAELLLEAADRYGPDRGLFMTLGTLYSGMYDYENSRHFYLRAIEEALADEDAYFASVAYYNLSLLEHSFYHYNSALRYTEESIRSADRSPGHLAQGELYQSRMDFSRALAEYQKAQARDTTALSKVNLAALYQTFGRLELARRYAEEVLNTQDLTWMYYYGTDLARHYQDLHELLADIYQGLARQEVRYPQDSLLQSTGALVRSLRYRLLAYYHRQKYRLYSIRVGRAYLEEKNLLDAYWEFYRGNEAYPGVALDYLEKARAIEVRVAPHAAAYYLQEEGKLRRSARLLEESVGDLDSFWEKEGIADALTRLIPLLKRGPARRQALNRLYRINPGGLQQYGLGLPLILEVSSGKDRDRSIRLMRRFLRRAGSELGGGGQGAVRPDGRGNAHPDGRSNARAEAQSQAIGPASGGFDYRLEIRLDDSGEASFHLTDRSRVVARGTVALSAGGARRRAAQLVRSVLDQIYSVP